MRSDLGLLLHRAEGDSFWALPGGRVDIGEEASTAVVREIHEELGETVQCGRLVWIVENFFVLGAEPHHEVGMYFEVSVRPDSKLLTRCGPFRGREAERSLEFAWFLPQDIIQLDIRPSFLKKEIFQDAFSFKHVVHRDEGIS